LATAFVSAEQLGKVELKGKLIRDIWDAAYLEGTRAGHIHTTVREIDRDGKKLYQTNVTLELTLRRFQDVIKQQMQSGTVETADGKVTAVSMSQTLGKEQQLELHGAVQGKQLAVKVSGKMNMDKLIPWNEQVIGLYREQQIFKEKAVKPGDKFSYLHYEPVVNAVVTIQVAVKDQEIVDVTGIKQKLLRAEAMPEKIMGVQLPLTVFWLDKDFQVIRSQVDMPGLGKLTLARTTREVALSPVTAAKITDIGLTQLIPLNRRIPRAHDSSAAVYRITLPADDEPAKAFAGPDFYVTVNGHMISQEEMLGLTLKDGKVVAKLNGEALDFSTIQVSTADTRQQAKNAKGKSFELHVKALRKPLPMKDAPAAAAEFLKSNYFVNSEDAKVQELAKKAVATEKDPWQKALRIEKWVHDNMKIQNFTEAMATSDHVARTLEGDCTEYAMLTAAMCKAVGVPARTALGFVYVDAAKGPVFGYHMWTEVYVQGQWLALDATLGRGSVGAGHIKITDHSWHDTRSLAPLLPVMRVMLGKPAIEVIRVEGND
jgi:transglutaminase-like putative cysteine protease